jgi:hypothetical protein
MELDWEMGRGYLGGERGGEEEGNGQFREFAGLKMRIFARNRGKIR